MNKFILKGSFSFLFLSVALFSCKSSQEATAKQLGLDSTSRPPEAARKIQSMTANPKIIGLIPFSSANAENPGAKTGTGCASESRRKAANGSFVRGKI